MPRHSAAVEGCSQAMSIRFNTRVYELKRQGVDVTVLSLGEALFELPLRPMRALPLPAGFHYSHSRGLPELRDVLARYYAGFGAHVDPATQLIVTPGSKAAIQFALQAVLDPGSEVVMQQPCWVSYPEQVRLCHGVPVLAAPGEPLEALEDYVTDRTRAIVLCNPDNPTGRLLGASELEAAIDLARRRDLYLLVDEAYSDFVPGPGFVSAARLDPELRNVIVTNSTSKNLGMSGWRIGYAISNPGLIDRMLKVVQHVTTCAPTLLQWYLARHWDDLAATAAPQVAAVVAKRNRIAAHCERLGLSVMPGTTTFYLFVSVAPSALGSLSFCDRLLEEEHICVVPGVGYGPGCDGWVRVAVGAEPESVVCDALERLRDLARRTA